MCVKLVMEAMHSLGTKGRVAVAETFCLAREDVFNNIASSASNRVGRIWGGLIG
jgi:hypothetical protein